jgi:hypothetical protein
MELKYKIRSRKKYFILTVLFKQNIFFNYVLCIHIIYSAFVKFRINSILERVDFVFGKCMLFSTLLILTACRLLIVTSSIIFFK